MSTEWRSIPLPTPAEQMAELVEHCRYLDEDNRRLRARAARRAGWRTFTGTLLAGAGVALLVVLVRGHTLDVAMA